MAAREEFIVADVEFMVETGEWPGRIAQRAGTNTAALARLLYHRGRPDLARIFEMFTKRERRQDGLR